MASSDVDQKYLSRLASHTATTNPLLSASLYQLLGLSVLLSRKLVRARKLRKLDASRDNKSLALYHHILWLSREGLSILELNILPYTQDGQHGPECRVLGAKLRASLYHIFCLFHSQPPVSESNSISSQTGSAPADHHTSLMPGQTHKQARTHGNDGNSNGVSNPNGNGNSNGNGRNESPKASQAKQKDAGHSTGRMPTLREPITSITSETSFLTNPYANSSGGGGNSPRPAHPPGLPLNNSRPSAFLLPPLNFLPLTNTHFTTAANMAVAILPGSHPLRLSVALEHTAFVWDCLNDHDGARKLARKAIREVYRAKEGMDDADFEDAAELVGMLGKVMRRKSWEGTPHAGDSGATTAGAKTPEHNGGGGGPGGGARALQQAATRADAAARQQPHSSRNPSSGHSPARTKGSSAQLDPLEAGGPVRSPRASSERLRPRRSGGGGSGGGSEETTPRALHSKDGWGTGGSTTPRAVQHLSASQQPEMIQGMI
ncbi:uncharacterized protein K452DRAFT_284100 [Aplosporella prunicola CBS 121167]|uniref:14-3-3 domain-containing protein n=1 Tax=Aplosporella prunicola CBS 121167 TaxID=1176127 RepID=A0A6A6BNM8_9PEZI|nr:uncharacterized protein K452DRAFT_284100 [Aplosporella prunicola CBS 121167]KAF2145730.1 hypothetical protein K452DRAFT_284100 [Aplosporella prunicola CBS 121167]